MQQILSKDDLWHKFEELDAVQREVVATFIESLHAGKSAAKRVDKSQLLTASVWDEGDVKQIEDAQEKLNEWRLPEF